MVTSNYTNSFIPFCHVTKVLQGLFIKTNVTNSNFHLVTYDNRIKTLYISSRCTSLVATNLTKKAFFEVVLSDIWYKKFFSFFKFNSLSSSKMEVSKFAILSWHSEIE